MDTVVNQPPSTRAARLMTLASFIEHAGHQFDMECWCDCIAGHCARMLGIHHGGDMRVDVRDYLQIDYRQARSLFAPSVGDTGIDGPLSAISRKWAVNTLRYFAMTGKLDWKAARTGNSDLRRPLRRGERDLGYFESIGDVIIALSVCGGPALREYEEDPTYIRERSERAREPELA
jgi:hypothetical protein